MRATSVLPQNPTEDQTHCGNKIPCGRNIPQQDPDAALIALSHEFDRRRTEEDRIAELWKDHKSGEADRALDEAMDRCAEVARSIACLRAQTVDGMKAKARALAYCLDDDAVDLGGDTTDMLLANSIIRDLLAMPGVVETSRTDIGTAGASCGHKSTTADPEAE